MGKLKSEHHLHRLDESIERDKSTRTAHSGAAVHHDRLVIRRDAVAEGSNEADERRRRIRHPKVRPRRKVKVPYDPARFALFSYYKKNKLI